MGQAPAAKSEPQATEALQANATRDSSCGDALVFKVAGERFALPACEIAEIIRLRIITRLPHGPPCLVGVINLRGTVLPIMSLAVLLGHDLAASSRASRIVVMARGAAVGLLVDEISGLTHMASERRIDVETLLAAGFGTPPSSRARASAVQSFVAVESDLAECTLIGFMVAGQSYALPLEKVVEVLPLPNAIAEVLDTDDAMMGVISFRESLLPLVSLRVLLGLTMQGFERSKARVVVTRVGSALVGLVTDCMTTIIRVREDALDPVPFVLARAAGEARLEAICRLDGGTRLIGILSPAGLFDDATAARLFAGAQHGTATMSVDTDNATGEQFVVFQLADEHYGLPIAAVEEVVRCPEVLTRVPRAPAFIEGVMNLRGKIVPVIDQRRRFAVSGGGTSGRRVIVVTLDGLRAGFVVDAVSEVRTIAPRELVEAPDMTADETRIFDRIATIEHDGRMILLIDPKAMLDRAERDVLAALAADAQSETAATA